MGTMSRLYIRCGKDADLLARIRSEQPGAVIEAPSEFVSIPIPDGDVVNQTDTVELSVRYGAEVIFLGFASVTDAFAFTHCIGGQCVRHLRYGCGQEERWWEEVDGEVEAWERAAFFDDQQLEDVDEDDPERSDIDEMFRLARVRADTGWPILDARESARAVAMHFRLTDWLDDWAEEGTIAPRQVAAPKGSTIVVPKAVVERPSPPGCAPEPPAPPVVATGNPSPPKSSNETKRPWWRFW